MSQSLKVNFILLECEFAGNKNSILLISLANLHILKVQYNFLKIF